MREKNVKRRNADGQGSEGEGCTPKQGKIKVAFCDAFFCAPLSHLWTTAWRGDPLMKSGVPCSLGFSSLPSCFQVWFSDIPLVTNVMLGLGVLIHSAT